MPAIDAQKGRKAPARKKTLQIGSVVAKTQQAWEHPQAAAPKRAPRSSSGVAPNFPRYVPPRPGAYKPPPAKKPPKPTQIAHAQERAYHSQAGAVRRAAATQAKPGLGVGAAVRPKGHGQVLTAKRITQVRDDRAAHAREQAYKSLGESVSKQAKYQQATRKVKIGAFKVDPALLSKDPKVQAKAGLTKGGAIDKAAMLPGKVGLKALSNVPKDAAELAVTTPTSLAHLGVQVGKATAKAYTGDIPGAIKTYGQIGKEQIAPYKEAWHDPVGFATKHPVTSYLMFAPTAKLPLRAGARVARVAGKSTIRRAPATVPGTAIKEARTAAKQPGGLNTWRRVRGRTGETATEREVKTRVDEFRDAAQHREARHVSNAIQEAKVEHAHLPKHERKQAVAHATDQASEQARVQTAKDFAHEFGANVEPQVNVGHIAAAEAERAAAKHRKGLTRRTVKAARERIKQAKATARTAVADAPSVRALEVEREAHQRELARSQREHGSARVGVAEAKGRAAVSAGKSPTTPRLQELHGQRRAAEAPPTTAALPSREQYIAERPKPSATSETPTVERLTRNLKPGKPGISIESEHVAKRYRGGESAGWGQELPGSKVVVARDAQGKPIGALHMVLDEKGHPTVMEVAVDPAHRGKGVASQLVRAAHEAGYNVEAAAREGGLTEQGAALVHKNLTAKAAPVHDVVGARREVRAADRRVNAVARQLQAAEERASHLEGVTVGRAQAGRMTEGAGKRAADQAERVGHLTDAHAEALRHAADARERLKQTERGHRASVREKTKAIDEQIAAEKRRVGGVAPAEHDALLSALERRDAAAAGTQTRRAAIRDLDERIAEERRVVREQARGHVAEAQAEHARAIEQHGNAVQVHRRLKETAIGTARAHRETPLVNPEGAGRTFDNVADAKRVMYRLNQQGHTIPSGGLPVQLHVREPSEGARTYRPDRPVKGELGHAQVPLQFKVKQVGEGEWAVLPKVASQRMFGGGGKGAFLSHASVGSGKATGAKLMRTSRGAFTQATLPASLKWLGGQGVEALVRTMVAGAGPGSRALFKQVVERMNEIEPGAGDAFAMRVRGGQFGETSALSEQMGGAKTLAEDYAGTPLKGPAALATMAGDVAPVRVARAGWRKYAHGMTSGINGLIENTTREAMAGKALKQGPLLERRVHAFEQMRGAVGKVNRAIDEGAHGLMDVHSQAELVRTVDEMYGKYSRWSPEMRSLMLHWTPFLPWYLNTAKFLFHTLPSRHPGKAALLASMNKADQEWRKTKHLSLYGDKAHGTEPLSSFLMGSYPTGKDRYLRVGHYTPWGVGADVADAVAGLLLPQVLGPIKNLGGVDWKFQPLTKPGAKGERKQPFNLGEKAARAGVTIAESQVPLAAQAGRWTGLTPKYIDKREDKRSIGERLKAELPTTPTKKPVKKVKAKKAPAFGGGGFGSGGFGASGL